MLFNHVSTAFEEELLKYTKSTSQDADYRHVSLPLQFRLFEQLVILEMRGGGIRGL